MIQECVELCGLGILTAISLLLTKKFERTQKKADFIIRALSNPSQCVNTVEGVLNSYNQQTQFLNALGIKRLRKKEFRQTIVFEVMICGQINSSLPVYVKGYWPAIIAVGSTDSSKGRKS